MKPDLETFSKLKIHENGIQQSDTVRARRRLEQDQERVQPLQRCLQSVHKTHFTSIQPRKTREIRPDEVRTHQVIIQKFIRGNGYKIAKGT